ncbi:hypothetical protein L6R52_31400 [Myxococcota bacterium]|nr:hypothetical protein [Myxococcota bacterium]
MILRSLDPMKKLRSAALAVALAAAPGVAGAQGVEPIAAEDAATIANEVDGDLAKMRRDLDEVGKGFAAPVPTEVSRVDRRLSEGEIHFMLGDWLRASIVLLDVVEDPSAKAHPKFDECQYLLAESMRRSKNYGGARAYHEELLPRAQGERLKDVVFALLEIASATDRYENVDHYIERLRMAGTLSRPDVDYIYGKMLFKGSATDPSKVQRAYEVFRSVPAGNSISAQAGYYAGVALVKLGRYEEAIRQFNETLAAMPKTKDREQLRELTSLSLGRLYQEIGDVQKSTESYQSISQSSPYFGDMLHEVAWAHVRSANLAKDAEERKAAFTRALRATELLMATAPGSRLYPQARILQGNLQIRLDATETAYDTFQSIIDRYGAAKDKLFDVLAQTPDPKVFFDQLVAADLSRVGATSVLPSVALEWALEEDDMTRAAGMSHDLSESHKNLAESRELVGLLEAALGSEQKYGLVPGMMAVRTRSLSVENRMLNVNRRLLKLERRLAAPYANATEQAQLAELQKQLADLEAEIAALPQSDQDVESARGQIKGDFQEADRKAYRQTYRVASLRAQLVATELWINQNRDKLTAEEVSILQDRVQVAAKEVEELQKTLDVLQADIRKASVLANVDGGRTRARVLRDRYAQLMAQEIALLRSMRGRIPSNLQGVAQRTDQQRVALQQIDQDLAQLQASLDQNVQQKVDELRAQIAREADRLAKYDVEQQELAGTANGMLGPVASRTLANVGQQFKDFVLQADVGIIDVAWARKQAETKKVNELIKEQQDKTTELEGEFADVLED